jgi:hypothetical protein
MRLARLLGSAAAAVLLLQTHSMAGEIIAGEILVEAEALRPQALMTEPERRVLFINRSYRAIHIQFLMRNGEQHHIVHMPDKDAIWAIFHQVGRHPFVVHFLDRSVPDLYGAVEVVGDPYGRPDPLVCSGITVQGGCIER